MQLWHLTPDTSRTPHQFNANEPRAFTALYAAEGSDWFWWFDSDQDSDADADFDDYFRISQRQGRKAADFFPSGKEDAPSFFSQEVEVGQLAQGLLP